MAKLPLVAIIGRPNTGKSSLFNALIGERHAIVSDVAGTTRDHVAQRVNGEKVDYFLIDTAGMGGGSEDKDLEEDVAMQSRLALENSDIILFTINAREELTKSDRIVIDLLRKRAKKHTPVLLILTKCDTAKMEEQAMLQFQGEGIGDLIIATSSAHMLGIGEVSDAIEEQLVALHFEKQPEEDDTNRPPRIAIIGKPNVGKSSIVNALMSDPQRAAGGRLVSDIPGTTRDSSDTVVRFHEKEYILIDTAGLRRKARIEEDIESYASLRSIRSLEQADIVVMVLAADEPVSRQEKRIVSLAVESGKGIIFVINKSDLLTTEEKQAKLLDIREAFMFCKYAPTLYVSAKTREGLLKMFPLIETVVANRKRRITTKDLRNWFDQTTRGKPLGSVARSKHITQAEDLPPTFVIFVKNPKQVTLSQLRTLDNSIRLSFAFEGSPIRWITKGPGKRDRD